MRTAKMGKKERKRKNKKGKKKGNIITP